ncbi:unnamed protein product [Mytilus coruscus]|uniref:Uncharacterized protein n=1 Tax=Mytilus coruscus TaxID=42192 RepID=A0A6J8D978_MYTCO|nr:unnamed protein product [Mytilus coruscus]
MTTRDGRSLYAYKVDDLVDSRVLCALVNSFVPNTFTSDLLLNDRWTINLALKAAERMLHADTPFNSEDLVESDPQSFRQSQAVLSRYDFMNRLIRECNHQLDKMPAMISNMQELQRRKDLKQEIEQHKLGLSLKRETEQHELGLSLKQEIEQHKLGLSLKQEKEQHKLGLSLKQETEQHKLGLSLKQETEQHKLGLSLKQEKEQHKLGLSLKQETEQHNLGLSLKQETEQHELGLSLKQEIEQHKLGLSLKQEIEQHKLGLSLKQETEQHKLGLSLKQETEQHKLGLSLKQEIEQHKLGLSLKQEIEQHKLGLSLKQETEQHKLGLSLKRETEQHELGLSLKQEIEQHKLGLSLKQETEQQKLGLSLKQEIEQQKLGLSLKQETEQHKLDEIEQHKLGLSLKQETEQHKLGLSLKQEAEQHKLGLSLKQETEQHKLGLSLKQETEQHKLGLSLKQETEQHKLGLSLKQEAEQHKLGLSLKQETEQHKLETEQHKLGLSLKQEAEQHKLGLSLKQETEQHKLGLSLKQETEQHKLGLSLKQETEQHKLGLSLKQETEQHKLGLSLKQEIEQHKLAQEKLKKRFDIKYCQKWMQHVEDVKSEVRKQIRDKMKDRFDVIDVPRNISVNDYCLSCVVNLTLTNGSGFYLAMQKESLPEGRKVVLRNKRTKEFHDDFSGKRGKNIYRGPSVRELLKLPSVGLVDVHPNDHPDYEIYVEASSRNKQLKAGQQFLYQVFHGNTVSWQRLFIKAARDNEYETVEKMIVFFQSHPAFINSKEPKSANTALHWACRNGHFDVVRLLLENGANIDAKNIMKNTPLNAAIEGLHRKVCHLLIEWGCDVHCRNTKQLSPFETVKNDDFKKYLIELYEHYSNIVPKIMSGDMDLLDRSLSDHSRGYKEYCCLRSRCINGSTLLHTTAYHGHIQGIRDILSLRVDVNVRDYKGATALHRSRNASILEEILDSGALVDAEDSEGNTPLHVKCYGETGKPAEMASIELLLHKNANICKRNNRSLLPIHCCAMQGRIDVMKMLIRNDQEGLMIKAINAEEEQNPPSLPHLAVANDFIDSAKWLIENGFYFKEKEQNILLRRILTEQLNLKSSVDAVQFLLDNDAEVNPRYPGGNCALHYSAGLDGSSEILELFLSYGADVDPINEEGRTPLFYATQANNQFAACVLLEQGANVRQKDVHGLTAFDYIVDYDEWIECGYFTDDIKARLKAFSLKHARDLVRAISKKVKTNPFHPLRQRMITESTMGLTTPGSAMHSPVQTKPLSSGSAISAYSQLSQILPPINRRQSVGMGYLHHTGNVGLV